MQLVWVHTWRGLLRRSSAGLVGRQLGGQGLHHQALTGLPGPDHRVVLREVLRGIHEGREPAAGGAAVADMLLEEGHQVGLRQQPQLRDFLGGVGGGPAGWMGLGAQNAAGKFEAWDWNSFYYSTSRYHFSIQLVSDTQSSMISISKITPNFPPFQTMNPS